jgi:hypothetical protein
MWSDGSVGTTIAHIVAQGAIALPNPTHWRPIMKVQTNVKAGAKKAA